MAAHWVVTEPYALRGKKSAVNTFDSVVEVGNMLMFSLFLTERQADFDIYILIL